MRTLTAIALIACLAYSNAASVTIKSFDTSALCTAGTTVSADATANKLYANTATVDLDTCTKIGTTTNYAKISGTSSAPTTVNTWDNSACTTTGTSATTSTTLTFSSNARCLVLDPTNTAAVVATTDTPSVNIAYTAASGSTAAYVTISAYDSNDCSTTASTGSTKNLFYKSTATTAQSDTCTEIGTSTGKYFKIVFTSTAVTSFKTYGTDSYCGAGQPAIDTATTALAWDTCLKVSTSNSHVWASSTPYVKLAYSAGSTTNGYKLSVVVASLFAILFAALF